MSLIPLPHSSLPHFSWLDLTNHQETVLFLGKPADTDSSGQFFILLTDESACVFIGDFFCRMTPWSEMTSL